MIFFSPELIFLRMKIRPPAMSRNKEKIRVPPISPNGRSLQHHAKPKRKLRELRLSINGRRFKEPKPKINVAYNVGSYTQAGISTAELHARRCISLYYFPVNEAPKPDLRVGAVKPSLLFTV